MSTRLRLSIDTQTRNVILSSENASPAALPQQFQNDLLSLGVYLYSTATGALLAANFTGASLTVNLASGSTLLSTATLTEVAGSTGSQFTGQLSLNTAAITTLLASSASASAFLIVVATDPDGSRTTLVSAPVTINKDYSGVGSPQTVPGHTYYTAAECAALFARLIGNAGQQITLVSPDGTHRRSLGVDDDGNPVDNTL